VNGRNWQVLLVLAIVAALVAYLGTLSENVGDLLQGMAIGLAIGAFGSWMAERRVGERV